MPINRTSPVYNLRGGFLGSVTPVTEQKDFRTQSTSIYQFSSPSFSEKNTMSFKNTTQGHGIKLGNFNMGLPGLYQDILTPKEFVPEGVQLTRKLELFWSTDQRLL